MEIKETKFIRYSEGETNSSEVRDNPDKSFFSLEDTSIHFKTTLKDRIRTLLSRLGRSQNWLAEQSGTSSGTMSKIVNGEWSPSSHIMVRMAEVLECDSVILFGDSEYWKEYNEKIKYPEEKEE